MGFVSSLDEKRLRLTVTLLKWMDRWVPARLRGHRTQQLRARVVVGASICATTISFLVQTIRLCFESQHWFALLSWGLSLLLFAIAPVVLRRTEDLSLGAACISLAVLTGAVGVAVMEGGVNSPNTMVLLVAPVVASLLGGTASGGAIATLVALICAALLHLHGTGVVSGTSPLDPQTLLTMRATIVGALSITLFMLTYLYETERDRAEAELVDKADAIETARRVEAENARIKLALLDGQKRERELAFALVAEQRKEMEHDLQLTAVVQSLLLPAVTSWSGASIELAGHHCPASQASGDWWWWENLTDGRLRVLLGDVTGHGAGAAMVTAMLAGCHRTLRDDPTELPTPALIERMHRALRGMCQGQYTMPFTAIELDPQANTLRWWNAGAPPILLRDRLGHVQAHGSAGTPLGSEQLHIGYLELPFGPGARALLYSDGTSEMTIANGKQLGIRKLRQFFEGSGQPDLIEARSCLLSSLADAQQGRPADDDVTFAIIGRPAG